jgi:hypothetical protein
MSDAQSTGTVNSSESQSSPNLNISDLVNVLQIIRTCAQRGTFRADEMSSVGGLYDRLQDFLVSTGAVKLTDADGDAAQQPAATPAQ